MKTLGEDDFGDLPPETVVALLTGSQGEPRAALARIAEDQHPQVKLGAGDLVIFSARTIPGNETRRDPHPEQARRSWAWR